ncbi:MAG: hypothetical protein PVG39_20910 [Desulfobacteraceae bacterium]
MAGRIVEIWQKNVIDGLPQQFTVGEAIENGPVVKEIDYRESGAMAGKRYPAATFVVTFEGTPVERHIPALDVCDIAYIPKNAVIPGLEE